MRDLDAAVWSQRWQVLYGIADEWGRVSGEAINADMHDPREWVPYTQTRARPCGRCDDHGIAVGIVSNTGWDVRTVFAAHWHDRTSSRPSRCRTRPGS